MLLLDDIHWAARPTLLLLRHLIAVASAAPVMVVATYRDTDLDRTHRSRRCWPTCGGSMVSSGWRWAA